VQVPDEVRKCAGFVGARASVAEVSLRGTFFLVEFDGFLYATTAAHVYEGVRRLTQDGILYLRMNLKVGGSTWAPTRLLDWVSHPTDHGVDVAVCQVGIDGLVWDVAAFPMSLAAIPSVLNPPRVLNPRMPPHVRERLSAPLRVELGDEVFLTGLFAKHYGKARNIPIVRTGAIAAMPEERIAWRRRTVEGDLDVEMDAYLVEARSIGGLSGSPVFFYPGPTRQIGGSVATVAGRPAFYLLGLMHGHWDEPREEPDAVMEVVERVGDTDSEEMRLEKVNMGIGIVVPVESILAVLEHAALEQRVPVNLEASGANGLAVPDV
jgi:hypothetical protein